MKTALRNSLIVCSIVAAAAVIFASIQLYIAHVSPENTIKDMYGISPDREILTLKECSYLMDSMLQIIQGNDHGNIILPDRLSDDKLNRTVFITAGNLNDRAVTSQGSGRGITEALQDSIRRLKIILPHGYRPSVLKLDIVDRLLEPVTINDSWYIENRQYNRSLHGLSITSSIRPAVSPDEIISRNIVNSNFRVNIPFLASYLEDREGRATVFPVSGISAIPFTTQSFYHDGSDTLRLYRGHRIFMHITREDLIRSCCSAGSYLCSSINRQGRFIYLYSAKHDTEADEYNYLRHCGTVYALMELYRITGDRMLLHSGRLALAHISAYLIPFMGKKDALCLCGNGSVKLGGAGLALIAMSSYSVSTGDMRYLNIMKKLARYIALEQKSDGSFIHMRSCPGFPVQDFTSLYYPGEAILGLLMLYEIDSNPEWLNIAEKSAKYRIMKNPVQNCQDTPHDHWLVISLERLLRHRYSIGFCTHALKIADSIISMQLKNSRYPDWIGSYHDPPGSASSATRAEALVAAFRIASDFGPDCVGQRKAVKTSWKILNSLYLNAHFQLGCQFHGANSIYLPDPSRAIGGFKAGLDNYNIRIDYVQHNISALLGFYSLTRDYSLDLNIEADKSKKILKDAYRLNVVSFTENTVKAVKHSCSQKEK